MSSASTINHHRKLSDEGTGLDVDDHVGLLMEMYDQASGSCPGNPRELSVSRRAYLELRYVVNVLLGTSSKKDIPCASIYDELSDQSREEIDPALAGVGPASVADGYETLTIHAEENGTLMCKRGEPAARAGVSHQLLEGSAAGVTDAVDHLLETGDAGCIESLCAESLCPSVSSSSGSRSSTCSPTSSGSSSTSTGATTSTGTTPTDANTSGTGTSSGTYSNTNHDTNSNNTTKKQEGPGAIESTTSNTTGSTGEGRKVVLNGAEGIFQGREDDGNDDTPCGTPCGNTGRKRENRRGLDELSRGEIEALKSRSPNGDCPRLPPPKDLCQDIYEWRPVLKTAEPFAAICQHILFSRRRDDDWHREGECVGMPIPKEIIFGWFGLAPQTGYNRGINSTMLLELYRREVDPELRWSDWNEEEGKARVVKSHGIPTSIIEKTKEALLGPEEHDNYMYLIGGKSVSNRRFTADLRAERRKQIDDPDPIIDPPSGARLIRDYLNSVPQQRFGHGGYGTFKPSKIECGIEAAQSRIRNEQGRDQELRKLYWIRHFPQPLYLPCDRSPRLRADSCNQAMNLTSEVLRSMYTDGDYELDLSKAHLAGLVVVADREGIDASLLRSYLEGSMEGEKDLWTELASAFSEKYGWSPRAARSAAKKIYAAAYGATDNKLLLEMSRSYEGDTGQYRSFEAFEPVLQHELVDEIRRIRDQLEVIINDRGGLKDADGRFISLSKWNGTQDRENRWRGVLSYVNATYEQKLMAEVFRVAREERDRGPRTKFRIWLYQADGVTIRTSSKASGSRQVNRLQSAVAEKAEELEMPTQLEVDYPDL